jgi:hypothetical protein
MLGIKRYCLMWKNTHKCQGRECPGCERLTACCLHASQYRTQNSCTFALCEASLLPGTAGAKLGVLKSPCRNIILGCLLAGGCGFVCSCVTSNTRASPTPPWFRREGETMPCKYNNSLLLLDLFLYLSLLFRRRKGSGETMGDHAGGCRLHAEVTASFIAPQCNN